MLLARNIMIENVITQKRDTKIQGCIELLFKTHVGSIVIVDDEQRCTGLFTERDVIRVVAQKIPLDAPIEKVMTKNIFTVDEDATFEEVKTVLKTHGIRHLPVVNSAKKLVGLISVRQILDQFLGL
jgi:CBS domain-containing protein